MIGVAFILGFFGRVAQKQLEIIAKYIFSRAWALAEQGFYVQGNDVILLGEEAAYKTSPASEVLWAATPVGTIKADSGVYTAPSTPEEHGKPVFIQAMLKGETSITAVKEATLKLFKISGPTDVESGGEINLSLETRLIDKITEEELKATKWTADDTAITIQPDVERAIKFNAPAVTKEDKEKTIRITATLTHDNKSYSDDLIITVLPKKEEGA